MYTKGFYLTEPVGNNAFSFEQRTNKKLWVPAVKAATSLDEIQLQDNLEKIAFEDFGFDDKLSTNYGLKHFYRFTLTDTKGKQKELILFDNHNHALYFWYEAFYKGIIGKNTTVIHIDEHADTRDNEKYISPETVKNLEKMFEFTNFVTNVGDYILPAIHEGLVGEVIQIRNTQNLEEYRTSPSTPLLGGEGRRTGGIILNLDLDFFQPDLDFIDYDLKKEVVLDAFEKADVVTVCTSPFFINQELAVEVFKDIFGEYFL